MPHDIQKLLLDSGTPTCGIDDLHGLLRANPEYVGALPTRRQERSRLDNNRQRLMIRCLP